MDANIEAVRLAFESGVAPPSPKTDELERYLRPAPEFSRKWLDILQDPPENVDPSTYIPELYEVPNFENRRQIQFQRIGLDGKFGNPVLLEVKPSEATGTNSLSLTRQVGKKKDFVRGRSGRLPFTPGGLDLAAHAEIEHLHRDDQGLFDQAPGLSRPGAFEVATEQDLVEQVRTDADDDEPESNDDGEEESLDLTLTSTSSSVATDALGDIDYLLPEEISFIRQRSAVSAPKAKVWAHIVDISQPMDNFAEMVPNPARTWPFELDTFQKEAIYHLEQGDSVFVAAHTSAGKTVIAEYAMSMAQKHMTKCIYTSPIKALSNQKYRDFSREYDDVGILTGDIQLNPEASTLIMTTEILRSMLYRGADIIRDVEFVIFDEVHYVNDSDRGVVWEEVIIMLPDHVKFILLSATVPNTYEFASWVGRTKQKNIYVISTPKRPVPLTYNLWGKKKLFEIVGEDRKFNESAYRKFSDFLKGNTKKTGQQGSGTRGGGQGGRGGAQAARGSGRGGRGANSAQNALRAQVRPTSGRYNSQTPTATDLRDVFSYLKSNNLLPAVTFVFSRKMCEQHAQGLKSMDLNTAKEKSAVVMFMESAVSRLRQEDRELPQILMLRDFLMRGIGIHHSGLLPIMKEVVEILFARGLVKILFATETFAMGLNLPTRTVIFTNIRKFDSKTMRNLTPGEFTQMAGRAGRRGLDKVGTVIILNTGDVPIPQKMLNDVLLGTPTKLVSQFRLTYTMILSLLRIEAVKVEDVIQQSFSENATHMLRPETERQIKKLEGELEIMEAAAKKVPKEIFDLVAANSVFQSYTTTIYQTLMAARSMAGQLCLYKDPNYGNHNTNVGVIMKRKDPTTIQPLTVNNKKKNAEVLPYMPFINQEQFHKLPDTFTKSFKAVEVPVSDIEWISKYRIDKKLSERKFAKFHEKLKAMQQFYLDTFYKDPTEYDSSILRAIEARKAVDERNKLIKDLQGLPVETVDMKQYQQACEINEKRIEIGKLKNSVQVMNTELLPDYEQRVGVLQDGNYIDENMNVLLKGRVACEISTGFELYMTELLLDNFLASYEPEEIVALLSAFVYEGARGVEEPETVTPKLDQGKKRLLEIVDYVHELAEKRQVALTSDEAEFAEKGRFGLMEVVYEWARGLSFYEITKLTTVHEGLIVRVISRMDEICRAVMNAARIMGDVELYDKVAIAQEKIKRDIVFCSSLYL